VNPFTELEDDFGGLNEDAWAVISRLLPVDKGQIKLYLPKLEQALKRAVSFDEVCQWLDDFITAGRLQQIDGPFGPTYTSGEEG
jgi:hypothetical protein